MTILKAPIHFVCSCLGQAVTELNRPNGNHLEALTRLNSAAKEAQLAASRCADPLDPASVALVMASHGAQCAAAALLNGDTRQALGAARATWQAISGIPAVVEAHVATEGGRA